MNRLDRVLRKERKWELEKYILTKEQKIKSEKNQFKPKLSMTKMLMAFLFLNCTAIEIFTGWVTIKSFSLAMMTGAIVDFSPLIALISAVVGEVIAFAIYALKSTKENTKGGIVYDAAINNLNSKG